MAYENRCKEKMLKGEPVLTCWLSMGSPIAAEIVANAGFDGVVLDHEHGPGDLLNAVSLMQAAGAAGVTPMMRVPWNDMVYIKRALDIGVMGIVVPYVQNAEEAKAAVDACRYPTQGIRGVAPHAARCSLWGQRLGDYLAAVPDNILVACQIETEEAIDNIESIAAVDGVDMLFLGPSDVSASVGHMLDLDEPKVNEQIERAERKMRATGKLMATVPRPGRTLKWMFEQGYHMIVAGGDARLLQSAALAQVEEFRNDPPARR